MTMKLLLKKLRLEGKEFLTSHTLKEHCRHLGLDYRTTVRYFISRGYLVRIFRGIFYLRSLGELEMGKTEYSPLELVARGLELKGIERWYFGLYSALKMNNMTHEHFSVDYVLNDTILRTRPMEVAGRSFRFLKIKPGLFGFGVKGDPPHSDPEKTILDFIYIWRYRGRNEKRIVMDLSEYADRLDIEKLRNYSKHYPKSVRGTMELMG